MTRLERPTLLTIRAMPDAVVGDDVEIVCESFEAIGPFTIGRGCRLEAKEIILGSGARLGDEVVVKAIHGGTTRFAMGDHALLDDRCNVMVPEFVCGDYTRVFRNALISGYKPVSLGHNCWIGQGAILNSAEDLRIGNNVRMGGAQIWTHVASGELLEGSRFYNEAPVTIEDDVWLMGFGHLISPGVTLARGTVVMAGSVVSRSTAPGRTYSGVPARDITDKLPAWDALSLDRKWEMLTDFVREFIEINPQAEGLVDLADTPERLALAAKQPGQRLIFCREVDSWIGLDGGSHSVFDLSSKTYLKQRSPLEVSWHHFALGFRARFIPRVS